MRSPNQVILITPPSIFLLDERVFVSLGILRVAAVLEQNDIGVEHLDLSGVENYLDALEAHLHRTAADRVGITVTTPQLPSVVKIVEKIRRVRPDIRIILGGPHITLSHSALKAEEKRGERSRAFIAFERLKLLADVLVSGDGELAIFEALKAAANPFSEPVVIDADDPKGGLFMSNAIYDAMPFPARHLVNMETYRYQIEGRPSTSLIAQLGCPFGCGFCGGRNSKSLRMIRTRSSRSIVDEIRLLYRRYGYTGFMFYDDELNVNKAVLELMDELARLQDELGVEFSFRGFVKAQLFTAQQASAMYRAGFRWLLSGFESGSPRILENINKRSTRDENSRAVEYAKAAGLKVKALMSVGHPGESEETLRQTEEWLLRSAPDEFDCTIITTYPGTPYYDEARPHHEQPGVWTYSCPASGDRLHSYEVNFLEVADYYKGDPQGGYRSFVFTDLLTAEDLVRHRDRIEATARAKLEIPYPKAAPSLHFEHSMGQGANGDLPGFIFSQSMPRLVESSPLTRKPFGQDPEQSELREL